MKNLNNIILNNLFLEYVLHKTLYFCLLSKYKTIKIKHSFIINQWVNLQKLC